MMPREHIDEMINDVYDLGFRILRVKQMVNSLPKEISKEDYQKSLNELFEHYDTLKDLLKHELVSYLDNERESGGALDLTYRRVLSSLQD